MQRGKKKASPYKGEEAFFGMLEKASIICENEFFLELVEFHFPLAVRI
jgi:hypothetical protein